MFTHHKLEVTYKYSLVFHWDILGYDMVLFDDNYATPLLHPAPVELQTKNKISSIPYNKHKF